MEIIRAFQTLRPGPLTTVQDLGRIGFGRYGVPRSGAVDAFSLRVANCLVGNSEGAAALEMTLLGPTLMALENMVIAITGGDLHPIINGQPVPMWKSVMMKKDDQLAFGGLKKGFRAYLAVGGGIAIDTALGSRSTNLGGGFGGLSGRPIKKGDILFIQSRNRHLSREGNALPTERIPKFNDHVHLRMILGPQAHHFNDPVLHQFQKSTYLVTEHLDRTGIRLNGPPLREKPGLETSIISEGVVPGTIQIPGDHQPIIVLGETVTGGYRKIASVISADLHLLGQLKPGNRVKFVSVSRDEAINALRKMEKIIKMIAGTRARGGPAKNPFQEVQKR